MEKVKSKSVPFRCQKLEQIKILHPKPMHLCRFQYLKPYKIPEKTVFKYREGGKTVGSGRVASIIE